MVSGLGVGFSLPAVVCTFVGLVLAWGFIFSLPAVRGLVGSERGVHFFVL